MIRSFFIKLEIVCFFCLLLIVIMQIIVINTKERGKYEQQFVLNGDTWEEQIWNGLTYFYGNYILIL